MLTSQLTAKPLVAKGRTSPLTAGIQRNVALRQAASTLCKHRQSARLGRSRLTTIASTTADGDNVPTLRVHYRRKDKSYSVCDCLKLNSSSLTLKTDTVEYVFVVDRMIQAQVCSRDMKRTMLHACRDGRCIRGVMLSAPLHGLHLSSLRGKTDDHTCQGNGQRCEPYG